MMDNTLDINGNSKISTSTLVRISNLKIKSMSDGVESNSQVEGNIKGIMKTIFTGGGTATFTGTVVNMGSTEAILSTINLLNESNNSSPTCITMSIDGLKVGDKLTPSQEQNFTVTVTSTCIESSTKTNEFSLSYIPVNPSEGTTTIDERITNLENQITALQTENKSLQQNVSNNNLLINSNFQVWQRGLSFSTSGSQYTADHWYTTLGSGSKVTKANGGFQLEKGANQGTVKQFIELNDSLKNNLLNQTVTLSFKVHSSIAMEQTIGVGKQRSTESLPAGDYVFKKTYTLTSGDLEGKYLEVVICDTNVAGTITYQWVKLEMGTYATSYIPKSYNEELISCQRYFNNLWTSTFSTIGHGQVYEGKFLVYMPIPTSMYKTSVRLIRDGDFTFFSIEGSTNIWYEGANASNDVIEKVGCMPHQCSVLIKPYSGLTMPPDGTSFIFQTSTNSTIFAFEAEIYP